MVDHARISRYKKKKVTDIVSYEEEVEEFILRMRTKYGVNVNVINNVQYSVEEIEQIICDKMGITYQEAINHYNQASKYVITRQLIAYVCCKKLNLISAHKLGKKLHRDHSTLLYGNKVVSDMLDTKQEPYYSKYNEIMEVILKPLPGNTIN